MRSNYSTILFDLDGTITDPQVGITKSHQYAFQKMGIEVNDPVKLLSFIGPPIRDNFRQYITTEEDVEKTFGHYTEYYGKKGVYEVILYPEIESLFKLLQKKGKRMFVATSKTTFFAQKTIEYFGLEKYFEEIVGPYDDGRRSKIGRAHV